MHKLILDNKKIITINNKGEAYINKTLQLIMILKN